MPGEFNNRTTTDAYQAATCVGSTRVRIIVRNASIYYRLAYNGGKPGGFTEEEKFLPPGGYPLDESERPFDAIAVRSAAPGAPAQVTVDCVRGAVHG